MASWSTHPRLALLAALYKRASLSPASVSDEALVTAIQETLWPTNCWAYAEAAFAIIAPACLLRPSLTPRLLRLPLEAMIAGALSGPQRIIPFAVECATRPDPYVEVTDAGRLWLTTILPALGELVTAVFQSVDEELRRESAAE